MSKDKGLISRLRNKESIRLSDIYDNEECIESITGNPNCKSDENMKVELLGHVELNGVNDFFAYDRNFQPGDVVKYFKGGLYTIVAIGTNTETEEDMVVYKSLKDREVWIRPYDMFASKVNKKTYPNTHQPYRFVKVKRI